MKLKLLYSAKQIKFIHPSNDVIEKMHLIFFKAGCEGQAGVKDCEEPQKISLWKDDSLFRKPDDPKRTSSSKLLKNSVSSKPVQPKSASSTLLDHTCIDSRLNKPKPVGTVTPCVQIADDEQCPSSTQVNDVSRKVMQKNETPADENIDNGSSAAVCCQVSLLTMSRCICRMFTMKKYLSQDIQVTMIAFRQGLKTSGKKS